MNGEKCVCGCNYPDHFGERKGDWFWTFTGKRFWPLDPRAEEIDIRDIAHSLSLQCRYNGHCREFYSVAQHSVIVSEIAPAAYALWGLLHDASEAYLSDMIRPLKRFSALGDRYREIEDRLMRLIALKYGLAWPEPDWVKKIDNDLLLTEKRDLLTDCPFKWHEDASARPLDVQIIPVEPIVAEKMFLIRFESLMRALLNPELTTEQREYWL